MQTSDLAISNYGSSAMAAKKKKKENPHIKVHDWEEYAIKLVMKVSESQFLLGNSM